jgi:V-type H+-transporting ATPase subunit a
LASQKASIAEFKAWKVEQEELWRDSAEKYSSVLKFWDSTLKMLVSRYRKHQAEVEQQLAAISEAQYTIELWEAVARRHSLDSKALGAAALADARALAVVGSGMGGEAGGTGADDEASTDGVSVDLAGFAGHAAAAGMHGGGGGGLGDAAPRFFVGLVSPDQAGDFDRILRQVTRGTIRASFEPAQRPLADREGNRVQREVFFIPIVGSELPRRVLAVLESYDTFRLEEDSAEVQAALMSGSADAIREQIKRALIRRSNHMDLLSKNRYILASDQQERSKDIDLYRRALLRERATAFTITKFAPSSASAMSGGGGRGGGDGGVDEAFLRAEGWILAERRPRVEAMVSARDGFLRVVDEAEVDAKGLTPPTHFPLNDVTAVFQSIIDTYSVPKYREINPAIFTAATFPALFGIMYGDVGHAGVLTIASTLVACSRGVPSWLSGLLAVCGCGRSAKADAEQEKPGEFMETMWFARYVLLLNGIFGMYMGVLYNDFFSMGLDWFGSRYTIPEPSPGRMLQGAPNATLPVIARREGTVDNVYPLGIDPVWHEAGNQLTFTNSLKMKMAIVVAIVHMTFGLSLRVANDWYFSTKAPSYIKRRVAWWKIWLEDIPMIVVLLSLFGYMSFLIVFKWCIDWSLPGAGQPPNLVDTMIGMVLSPGTIKDEMYPGQATVQLILLFCVLGCIPLILLGKPLVEAHLHKLEPARLRGGDVHSPGRHAGGGGGSREAGGGVFGGDGDHGGLLGAAGAAAAGGDERAHHSLMDMIDGDSDAESSLPPAHAAGGHGTAHGGHHEFEFGQEMVHQGIETIEFVLSTISHTASYLRLWALSLAHSQLSEVFWDKALRATIEMELAPAVIVGFAIWAAATAVVLCAMDVLECYLHSLRLHWVEFNSKFYGGEGSKFQPLSFDAIVDDDAEEL